jgi:hypothetical protein
MLPKRQSANGTRATSHPGCRAVPGARDTQSHAAAIAVASCSAHSDRADGGHENPAASELATEPAADAPVRREVENG